MSPAPRLRFLFKRRDMLAGIVARIDRDIAETTLAYCDEQGLRARPHVLAVRRDVGA